MIKQKRWFLVGLCILLILVAWYTVLSSKSNAQKQVELISESELYLKDKIYIKAVPLLEEAAGYNAKHTLKAENKLKQVYISLIDQRIYAQKYIDLLDKQMKRENAKADVFIEAAEFYLERSKTIDALDILKLGIGKLNDKKLIEMYEENRYVYEIGYNKYEEVDDIYEGKIGVKLEGLWGIASSDGDLLIPCEYNKVSNFSNNRVVVKKSNEIYSIDINQNRLSLLKEKIKDFGYYSNDRLAIKADKGWRRATGDFIIGDTVFEDIKSYSNGYVAAKKNGKWGLVDLSNEWLIEPKYDEVICDDLGFSYRQDAVFVRENKNIFLIASGKKLDINYEDAKPFNNEGYAAVKKDGKWGFIDSSGELVIDFQFEDALSFGGHLAAIKKGENWGYISKYGKIVIEPDFLKAKTFFNGRAPVLTNSGWQFIRLIEYKKGGVL